MIISNLEYLPVIYSELFYSAKAALRVDYIIKNFFQHYQVTSITVIDYALISTSTPDGRSSFESASTVLDEEV